MGSGFMVGSNRHTNTSNILTSATLVRSLCGQNIVIPDLKVRATYFLVGLLLNIWIFFSDLKFCCCIN